MTSAPWRHVRDDNDSFNSILSLNDEHIAYEAYSGRGADFDAGDAAAIVALVNAAPALIAEVRALRAKVGNLREEVCHLHVYANELEKRLEDELADARTEGP